MDPLALIKAILSNPTLLILLLIAGIVVMLNFIVLIIYLKKKKTGLKSQKGDLTAVIIDTATKTMDSIPADMISPNIYIGFLKDEPIYIFIPSDKYLFKDKKGNKIVFCEKTGTIVRPINPELEATLSEMSDTNELKELTSSNIIQLLYGLAKIDRKEGVIPIGTRLNLSITFKPSQILSEIIETIISDNVKTFDVITATATTIERMARLYQERTKMIQARSKMFGLIPVIIIAVGILIVMILMFSGAGK